MKINYRVAIVYPIKHSLPGEQVPRNRGAPKGKLGVAIDRAMEARGLTPQQVAAGARLNKGTLYKILSGRTREPHQSTLRKLCKVLQIDLASLVGAEQLDLLGQELESSGTLTELEELLALELRSFPVAVRPIAGDVAILALLEVHLGVEGGTQPDHRTQVDRIRRAKAADIEGLLISALRTIPRVARPAAVRSALGALLDLRLLRGSTTSAAACTRLVDLRHRLWTSTERPKRRTLRQAIPGRAGRKAG